MEPGLHQGEEVALPDRLPVFPLRNALLLPGGKLPLNIFEPRYLAMTDAALGAGRMIGMVRPQSDDPVEADLYHVGCAGRITSFMETEDGRYLITLTGVSRFVCKDEVTTGTPFRMMEVDWSGFTADLHMHEQAESPQVREALIDVLSRYLDEASMKADWDAIDSAPSETIVNSVAMSCPFSPDEKQAILEAETGDARAGTLITLMEMALAEGAGDMAEMDDKPSRLQ